MMMSLLYIIVLYTYDILQSKHSCAVSVQIAYDIVVMLTTALPLLMI